MSREIGGRADKDGNEFERLWLVWQALRVLASEATSLHWERPGEVGFGIEAEVSFPSGRREAHQCKIENGTVARWSAADLADAGVLNAAQRQLQRPQVTEFVFISRDPVPVVRDLAERSHRSDGDPEEFARTAPSSEEHRSQFERLCKAWELDHRTPEGRAHAFSLLQRLRFEIGFWGSQRGHLELFASLAAEGIGREIVASLADFLGANLGNEIHGDQIREHLRAAGHAPRDLRGDPRVAGAIERLRVTFERSLAGLLLGGELLPRVETQQVLRLLDDSAGPRVVLIHGPAGVGKSNVELELARTLAARGTPLLALRLDAQRPARSVSAYSRDVLELPAAEPALCLAALAGQRPAVLLIDQLDALRWTGGHSAEALQICKEIIEGARAVEGLRVVLACRSFDLDSDPTFKAWQRELGGRGPWRAERVEVKLLSPDQVEGFVAAQGGRYAELGGSQRELLRHPYTLFLWWEMWRERGTSPAFVSKTDLLSEYRRHLERKLEEMGQSGAREALDRLVSYLDSQGRGDAPVSVAGGQTVALEALQSLHVLGEPRQGRVTFTHQSLLDFLIAERVAGEALRGGRGVVDWLRHHEQSLFRREQLRQLLALLRDQSPPHYVKTIEEILAARDVRFHLQHLALAMLREAVAPLDPERHLVERLLATETWRQQVLEQVVIGHAGWFEALDDCGLFSRWLESSDERLNAGALAACRSVAGRTPARIERLLARHWEGGDEGWRERIDSALGRELHALTDIAFGWRVARVRTGALRLDWFQLRELARRHAARAIVLLEAHLAQALDRFEASGELAVDLGGGDTEDVEGACAEAPAEAWDRLLPILIRSVGLLRKDRLDPGEEHDFVAYLDSPRRGLGELNRQVRRFLVHAGGALARREGLAVFGRLTPLLGARSECLELLVLQTLLAGPDELADFALQWLAVDPRRFELGSLVEGGVLAPARRLLKRFAECSSAEIYRQIEARLLAFHARYEMRGVQVDHEGFRPRGWLRRSVYGRAQHLLLSELPRSRMSERAGERLDGWNRKFGEPKLTNTNVVGDGSTVRSAIPRERLPRLSDQAWLALIRGDWKQWRKGGRKSGLRLEEERFVERSDEEFARDFGEMARLYPERFAAILVEAPASSPTDYLQAFLRAVVEPPPAPPEGVVPTDWKTALVDAVERVLRHFSAQLQDREVALAVCRLVEERAGDGWSDWTIGLVQSYAAHADPQAPQLATATVDGAAGPGVAATDGDASVEDAGDDPGDPDGAMDLDVRALNCVRGAAAGTLMKLLFARPKLRESCLATVERLVEDPHPAVRVAAQGLCLPLLNSDRDRAIELFIRCCGHADDRVLAGMYMTDCLRRTWRGFPDQLSPVLARMIGSAWGRAAEKGAFWVTVGHVAGGLYGELAASSLGGNLAQRKGAANALALLCREPEWRPVALPGVIRCFEDVEPVVVAQAVAALRDQAIVDSPEGPVLAEAFVRSSAFATHAGDLFFGLGELAGSLVPYAHAIQLAAARLAELAAAAQSPAGMRAWGVSSLLPPILLRLYEQAEGAALDEVRSRCLDAWDSYLRGGMDLGRDVLARLDA